MSASNDPLSPAERTLVDVIRAGHLGADATLARTIGEEDWEAIAQAAFRHQLAPVLHASVNKLRLRATLPEEIDERLTTAAIRAAMNAMRAERELAVVARAFETARLPFIVLKGVAIAHLLYGSTLLRPYSDIDLLVRPEQRDRVDSTLRGLDYSTQPEPTPGFQRAYSFEEHYLGAGAEPSLVDVHWHLLAPAYYRSRADIDWFWREPLCIQLDDQTRQGLRCEALFIHLCAHQKLQNRDSPLIRSYDLALWLKHFGTAIDWPDLAEIANRFGLTTTINAACEDLIAHWWISPPQTFSQALHAARPGVQERAVYRVFADADTRLISVANFIYMRGLADRLHFLAALLFPDVMYLRQTQPGAIGQPIWRLYLRRWLALPLGWIRAGYHVWFGH